MSVKNILRKLSGGDLRSIRNSNKIAALALENALLIPYLYECLHHSDRRIRSRSADALEKVSVLRPGCLQSKKKELLKLLMLAKDKELRWHMAQIVPRLTLTLREAKKAYTVMLGYRGDESRIVRTMALQAMFDLALTYKEFMPKVKMILKQTLRNGSPSEKARARILSRRLANLGEKGNEYR